jgi:hypothetical protein
MKIFGIIFVSFWVLWLMWYITGGPLRNTSKYPLVKPSENGGYIYATSSTQK